MPHIDPVTLEKDMVTHSSFLPMNPMDRGVWWAIVQGITKIDTTQQDLVTLPLPCCVIQAQLVEVPPTSIFVCTMIAMSTLAL